MLERLLIAEVFASELAEALAPALAEQLAPRLMKSFEHLTTEAAGQKPAAGSRSTSQRRKPERRLSKLGWFTSASAEGMTAASRASLVPGERVDAYRPGDDQGGNGHPLLDAPGRYAQNADNRATWPNGALDLIHGRPDALPSFPGTARDALTFYGDVFGCAVQLHTFAEFNRADGPADAIAHGYFAGGPVALFGADVSAPTCPRTNSARAGRGRCRRVPCYHGNS
jgi:hypothetical protein